MNVDNRYKRSAFCQTHNEKVPSIRNIAQMPILLNSGASALCQIISFNHLSGKGEHFALRFECSPMTIPLVRLHSECITGDALGSARCDCGPQLQEALQRLHTEGGLLLYLRQEGRGIGLYRKLEAYLLQEQGFDTYTANHALGHHADERSYQAAADMLTALSIQKIRLLTNNPDKLNQLTAAGISVEACVATGVFVNPENLKYLETKAIVTHHTLHLPPLRKDTK